MSRVFPSVNFAQSRQKESGQVVIMVLLIMAVLLTVAISLAARTTQELSLSTQQAESTRVFSAAEAGVEAALSQPLEPGSSGSVDLGNGLTAEYQVEARDFEHTVTTDTTALLDLGTLSSGQSIQLSWSRGDDCTSLILTEYYETLAGVVKQKNTLVRPNSSDCNSRNDGFSSNGVTTLGLSAPYTDGYTYTTVAAGVGTPLALGVKPVYDETQLRVVGGPGVNLGVQSFTITSSTQNPQGDEERTVEVERTQPLPPSFMDYVVFSGGSLQK